MDNFSSIVLAVVIALAVTMAPKNNSNNHKSAPAVNGLTNGLTNGASNGATNGATNGALNGHPTETTMSEAHFNDVMQFFTGLYFNKTFLELKGLSTENERLKKSIDSKQDALGNLGEQLGIANKECKTVKEQLTKSQEEQRKEKEKHEALQRKEKERYNELQRKEKEKYEKLQKEREGLEKQRDDHTKELTRLYKVNKEYERLTKEHKELQETNKALGETLKEKQKMEEEFDKLKSYSFKLTSGKNPGTEIIPSLKTLVDTAIQFAHNFLFQDIQQELMSGEHWDAFEKQEIINSSGLRIPGSNSPAAKQMRFVAGLYILGRMLHKYIFQVIYPDSTANNQLSEFLELLDEEDDEREQYVRSVLLNALPEVQEKAGLKRAQKVAEDTMGAIGVLIPFEKHVECKKQLENISKDALRHWIDFQRLEVRVSSNLDFEREAAAECCVLELPPFVQPQEPVTDNNTQNGETKPSDQSQSQSQSQCQQPSSSISVADTSVACVVWPEFHLDGEILQPGLILTKSQMQAARDEVVNKTLEKIEMEEKLKEKLKEEQRRDSRRISRLGDTTRRRNSSAFLESPKRNGAGGG